jgi:hypothetical protein
MKVFFCETFDDGTVGGSHACMYNLISHMDRSEFVFTVGFCSHNVYAEKYSDLRVQVEIVPLGQPLRRGNILFRKVRNWYALDYSFVRKVATYFKTHEFDLIVLNNSIYASLPYVKAARHAGIPVVVYKRGIGYFYRRHIRATKNLNACVAISMRCYSFWKRITLAIPVESSVIGIIGDVKPWGAITR